MSFRLLPPHWLPDVIAACRRWPRYADWRHYAAISHFRQSIRPLLILADITLTPCHWCSLWCHMPPLFSRLPYGRRRRFHYCLLLRCWYACHADCRHYIRHCQMPRQFRCCSMIRHSRRLRCAWCWPLIAMPPMISLPPLPLPLPYAIRLRHYAAGHAMLSAMPCYAFRHYAGWLLHTLLILAIANIAIIASQLFAITLSLRLHCHYRHYAIAAATPIGWLRWYCRFPRWCHFTDCRPLMLLLAPSDAVTHTIITLRSYCCCRYKRWLFASFDVLLLSTHYAFFAATPIFSQATLRHWYLRSLLLLPRHCRNTLLLSSASH